MRLVFRSFALVLVGGVLASVTTGCNSADPNYAASVAGAASALGTAQSGFLTHYSAGKWMPSRYTASTWEMDQSTAVGAAVLGTLPNGSATMRQAAIDTVNRTIADHQLPNGDFDNGAPTSGTSDVAGVIWAQAQGLIALKLKPYVDAGTMSVWISSLRSYVAYLKSSGNFYWYANGNQALRKALLTLELKLLTGASSDVASYDFAFEFATDPTMGGQAPQWGPLKMRYTTQPTAADGRDGSGYLFEAANGGHPDIAPVCANGMDPCNGFDPHYTMLQLQDALTGYALSGDPEWLRLVNLLTNKLMPLVDRTSWGLDATNGSRRSQADLFSPQVMGVFDEHNLRPDLSPPATWPKQLRQLTDEITWFGRQPAPGPDALNSVGALVVPILDAQRTG